MNKINFLDLEKNNYYYIKDNKVSNEFNPLEDIVNIDLNLNNEKSKKSLINNLKDKNKIKHYILLQELQSFINMSLYSFFTDIQANRYFLIS